MKFRELGVRVTRYRERRQLSITQLANLLGVDYMQVTRYEKGQSLPSLDTAVPCASRKVTTTEESVPLIGGPVQMLRE